MESEDKENVPSTEKIETGEASKEEAETSQNDEVAQADDAKAGEGEDIETKNSSVGNAEEDIKEESSTSTAKRSGEDTPVSSEPSAATSSPPMRPPKRSRTAYFIFADEVRSEIVKEHPGEGVAAQAKRIGARWKATPDSEKERFREIAAKEKEAFVTAMAAYKEKYGEASLNDLPGGEGGSGNDLIFPMARIRKIAKLDPEVKTLSKEALQLVVKSAELVLAKLGKESVKVARMQNRRTLLADDVAHVCTHRDVFSFLKEDIRDLTKQLAQQKKEKSSEDHAAVSKQDSARASAASGTKPLTSYFGAMASNK